MSQATALWQWSATALTAALRTRQLSSREVVEAHLARIEHANPRINAVTVLFAEEALEAAGRADSALLAGAEPGPLHGLPITVKENFDVAGSATTHGVVALEDNLAQRDAPVIAHLRAAGAIILGRTNQPDFGLRWHSANDLRGATRNPWDPSLTPGGSSGGEAAALAAGLTPLGIGGDMGGSLRYPAYCCGVAALKPGLGRVSNILTRLFDDPPTLYPQIAAANGPLARHIGDLRLALGVMEQRDPEDPWWTPAPLFKEAGPVKVALTCDPGGHGSDPAVIAAVESAGELLADAGYQVEAADPPELGEITHTLEAIADSENFPYLDDMLPHMSPDSQTVLKWIVGERQPSLESYMMAIARRHEIAQAWNAFFEGYPLILGPVSGLRPFEVGYDVSSREALQNFIASMELTEACNLLGLASVAVPIDTGTTPPGGVQLIAPRFGEKTCLAAAEAIEARQGALTPIEPKG